MSTKYNTFVNILLDGSGSMSTRRDETIGAFNSYIDSLRADMGDDVYVTLTIFNTTASAKYSNLPIRDVGLLTTDLYNPAGWTALYDAIGDSIRLTEAKLDEVRGNKRVLFVIFTDGKENSSREFTKSDIISLIDNKTKTGLFTFAYLGVELNAFYGREMGMSAGNTMSYDPNRIGETFAITSARTKSYRAGGQSMTSNFYSPSDPNAPVDSIDSKDSIDPIYFKDTSDSLVGASTKPTVGILRDPVPATTSSKTWDELIKKSEKDSQDRWQRYNKSGGKIGTRR